MSFRDRGGYIATISAIIITGIVISISLVVSTSSFLSRFDSLGLEMKDISKEVAFGCIETAKLKLKLGNYAGGEIVSFGGYSCEIFAVQNNGNSKIIKVSATVDRRTTNLEMQVDATTIQTISLKEKQIW